MYIGQGNVQLAFAVGLNNPGDRRNSTINRDTFAIFTSSEEIDGTQVLESYLRVVATLDDPNPSVTCVHVDAGNRPNTITFQVLDM